MTRKVMFFNLMDDFLSKEGFVYLKSKNCFKKKVGKDELIIKVESWPMFTMVEIHLQVVIAEIEQIKKKAWGKLYEKDYTLGINKSYLTDNYEECKHVLETEQDIVNAVKLERDYYHTFSKGYFEKLLDINYLDNVLNFPLGAKLDLAYNSILTSFLAIIVGYIVGNPEKGLNDFYKREIEASNPVFLKKYELLVDFLTNRNLN